MGGEWCQVGLGGRQGPGRQRLVDPGERSQDYTLRSYKQGTAGSRSCFPGVTVENRSGVRLQAGKTADQTIGCLF